LRDLTAVCRFSSDGAETTVGLIGVGTGGGADGGATTTGFSAKTVSVSNKPVPFKAAGETADWVSIVV
jgi:hypothetical protein